MLGKVLSGLLKSGAAQPAPENPLLEMFFRNQGRQIEKWHHYLDIYHRHFAGFRGRSPVVLEIGVQHGGSLDMWRRYFGPGAQIVGVDVDARCKQFEGEQVRVLIGDQGDRGFLARIREQVPHIDILIDDGGHTMTQQIATFEELYAHIQPHGIYLCEDVHTSFLGPFGGGIGRSDTYLEYTKKVIDRLYAWYSTDEQRFAVDALTRSTYALHFYDSIVVIEKRPMEEPKTSRRGTPTLSL